jgi:hypothetical protein
MTAPRESTAGHSGEPLALIIHYALWQVFVENFSRLATLDLQK